MKTSPIPSSTGQDVGRPIELPRISLTFRSRHLIHRTIASRFVMFGLPGILRSHRKIAVRALEPRLIFALPRSEVDLHGLLLALRTPKRGELSFRGGLNEQKPGLHVSDPDSQILGAH